MIGFLHGVVRSVEEKKILLELQGLGLEIQVPTEVAATSGIGRDLALFTHLHVREDELSLYGFLTAPERDLFRLLLSVSGVGPKMGLELLSQPVSRIRQAIELEDKALLTSIRGVGDKLAGRLILELKNKLPASWIESGESAEGEVHAASEDALQALLNLGYDRGTILRVLKNLPSDIQQPEELIRQALQQL